MSKENVSRKDIISFGIRIFISLVLPSFAGGTMIYIYLWHFDLKFLFDDFRRGDPHLHLYALVIFIIGAVVSIFFVVRRIRYLLRGLNKHLSDALSQEEIIHLKKNIISVVPHLLFIAVMTWILIDLAIAVAYFILGQNLFVLLRHYFISTLVGASLTVIPAYFFLDTTIKKYNRIFFHELDLTEYSDIRIIPISLKILSSFIIGGIIPALILFIGAYDYRDLIINAIPITADTTAKFTIVTLAAFIISVIMALVSAYYFSQTIGRPLKRLDEIMGNIDGGDLNVCLKPDFTDEIGHISQGLSNMISRVRESVKYREELLLMEKELDIAEKVQCSVLTQPDSYKEMDGFAINVLYRPQNGRVGGDYYNILKVDDYISIIIADATGHGIQAALSTMQIDMINRQSLHLNDPGQRLEFLNNYYTQEVKGNRFFTASIVNLYSENLLYGSAGHPEQILVRSNGKLETLRGTGKLIGMVPELTYPSESYTIDKGDTLFLFTDGAFEQFGSNDIIFGEDRMQKAIRDYITETNSISECNKKFYKAIKEFTGDNGLTDDITVIAIRKL